MKALPSGEFVAFWKKVGIVGSGIIVAASIIGVVTSFAWRLATQPIVDSIREERISRATADSLLLNRIALLDDKFGVIGEALAHPTGSRARERALDPLWRRPVR